MKNFTRFLALTLAVLFAVGTISVAATQFADVTEETPYAKAIDTVSSMGIIEGVYGMFKSDLKVARYQFTVYAAKAITGETSDTVWTKNENYTTFKDVGAKTAPAAVSWAVSNDLIKGRSSTEFDPYTTITLAEASAIMVRALGFDYDVRYNAEQANAWKWAYVTKAMELGVTKGLASDALSPDHEITKAEAALLIYNTLFITRKNGSTIIDKVWADVEVGGKTEQLVITSARYNNGVTNLVDYLEVHTVGYVKLNGFTDGMIDDTRTLYFTSDEFKAYTGYTTQDVATKNLVGSSVDVTYEGDSIKSLSVNAPVVKSGLADGTQVSGANLVLGANTYPTDGVALYVAHESELGYPVTRPEGTYKMSVRGQVCYGIDGEAVTDYVGNKFFLDADNNIVAEWVHDVNSVAYAGVIVSGQYGKFASSAEIWVSDSSDNAVEIPDGNYRYANDADLAKAAKVFKENKDSEIANEAKIEQVKKEIAYGSYTVCLFDDDGDGEIDRIFVNGSVYTEKIARKTVTADVKTVEVLQWNDADKKVEWAPLVNVANNGNLSRKIRVEGVECSTISAFNAANPEDDYFICLAPDNGTIELIKWLPYNYGQVVNLAEFVNPTADYSDNSAAVIGIKDRGTGIRSDYYVDVDPAVNANITAATTAPLYEVQWLYTYNKVSVGVKEDVDFLHADPQTEATTGKILADRSVVVSQWVKFVHLPLKVVTKVSGGKVTATETKDYILYIAKNTNEVLKNMIYVASEINPAKAENAKFTYLNPYNGDIKTLENVNLVDTVFNKASLNWLYQLRTNLSIENGEPKDNYAVVASTPAAVVPFAELDQLWADGLDDATNYISEENTVADGVTTYKKATLSGHWSQAEIDAQVSFDAFTNHITAGDYFRIEGGALVLATEATPIVDVNYYTIADEVPADQTVLDATYYSVEDVEGHSSNLLYLTFTKDIVGEFYTVDLGNVVEWEETNMAKNVTEYTLSKDVLYQINTEADHANNPYYFVKGTTYQLNELAFVSNGTDEFETTFGGKYTTAKKYKFDNEASKFTTGYDKIETLNVYKVSEPRTIHGFWFDKFTEYSVANATPVVGYDANNQPVVDTFDNIYGTLTANEKKLFSVTDRSFEAYYCATATTGLKLGNANAADVAVSDNSANAAVKYYVDGKVLYRYDTNPYQLVKIADNLTNAQLANFKKIETGYKATETFISSGNATAGWNVSDKFILNAVDTYLYAGQALAVADLTAEQLEIVKAAAAASDWGGDLHGLSVIATEASVQVKTNPATYEYRYGYKPVADAASNLSFLNMQGVNYMGEPFNGMILLNDQVIGTVSDDTVFVVVSPKEVKVSADKKSYAQAQGFDFATYTYSEIQKMKIAVYQYRGNFGTVAQPATATYVLLFGNIIPGEEGIVKLVSAENGSIAGLEVGAEKRVSVGKVDYTVTPADGYPIIAVTVNGSAAAVDANGKFSINVEKDKTYNITVACTAVPVDKGQVRVTKNDKTDKVTYGDTAANYGNWEQLPVGEYTIKVTPKNGYPIVSVKLNGDNVELTDNAFTLTVEKDKQYDIVVTCSDVIYVYLDAEFNSTLTSNTDGFYVWTWTTAENKAFDIFAGVTLEGAVYESYLWNPNAGYPEHIYTGAGIYKIKLNPDPNGVGKYELIKGTNQAPNPVAKTNAEIADFLAGDVAKDKLQTGAFFGDELNGQILYFAFSVTEVANNAGPATYKISAANREIKEVSDFKFISITEDKGVTVINPTGTVNKEDTTAYNFLPWNLGDSYALTQWNTSVPVPTTAQISALTGNNTLEANTVLFKYLVGDDGKVVVFVNSTVDTAVTITK